MPPLDLFEGSGSASADRSTWGGYVLLQRFWQSVLKFPSSAAEDAGLRSQEVDNLTLAVACILLDRMSPADLSGDPLLFGELGRSDPRWLLPAKSAAGERNRALSRLWSWLTTRLFRSGCLMPEPIRLVSGEIEVPRFLNEPSPGRLEVRAALHASTGIPLWCGISPWDQPERRLEPLLENGAILVFGKSFPATPFCHDLPFNHNGQAAASFRGLERQMTRAAEGKDVLYPEDDLAGFSAREETRDAAGRAWTLFVSRDEEGEVLLGAAPSQAVAAIERWPRASEIAAASSPFFRRLKADFGIESLPEWLSGGPTPTLASRAVFATGVALASFLEASFVQTIIPDRPLNPESLRTTLLRIPIELKGLRDPADLESALRRQNQFAALVSRRLQSWLPE